MRNSTHPIWKWTENSIRLNSKKGNHELFLPDLEVD